jgi:hypothetical protein
VGKNHARPAPIEPPPERSQGTLVPALIKKLGPEVLKRLFLAIAQMARKVAARSAHSREKPEFITYTIDT